MQHPSDRIAEAQILAALRGEPVPFTDVLSEHQFLQQARIDGVEALLHRVKAGASHPDVAAALRQSALAFAAWEMRHRQVVAIALDALRQAGTPALVFKGTALAATLYEDPALRPRADTDLLLPPGARDRATDALRRCGFTLVPGVPSYQSTFTLRAEDGSSHSLDVHWRINNSELLSRTFDYEDLAARAVLLPSGACVVSNVDALLIACMHRATHKHYAYRVDGQDHHDPDRLIWLYDIHLLARSFTSADWNTFVDAATRKGLRALAKEGLAGAHDRFATEVPASVMHSLNVDPGQEAPARYLASGGLRRTWLDFVAMSTWRARLRWLEHQCFPPADYMRAKYPHSREGCLPCLYARRVIAGMWKRVRPSL
jgi:hypothetical protein